MWQNYLRSQLAKAPAVAYEVLPLDLFANGDSWSVSSTRVGETVKVVHYTHPGRTKLEKMKEHGHWILLSRGESARGAEEL